MNANELADALVEMKGYYGYNKEAAAMLRQQADRIAELEKVSSKPVAWWTGKFDDECEDFMFPDTRQVHIDHPQSETHNFFPIPLYTHPHRELSDEKIENIAFNYVYEDDELDIFSFARAIIKASRNKE